MKIDFGFIPEDKEPYYYLIYHTEDTKRIGKIARELNTRGMPIWYAMGEMSDIERKKLNDEKLQKSSVVLMFITQKTLQSEKSNVCDEYKKACSLGKNIIIIYLDNVAPNKASIFMQSWYLGISTIQGVNAFESNFTEEKVDAILDRVSIMPVLSSKKDGRNPKTKKPILRFSNLLLWFICIATVALVVASIIMYRSVQKRKTDLEYQREIKDTYSYLISDDSVIITGLLKADVTELTIPSMIEGKKVVSIGENAFSSNTALVSVDISFGVENIGDKAFSECTLLETVVLPGSVINIGESAFYKCNSLKTITLPDKLEIIGEDAFSYCVALDDIVIPKGIKNIRMKTFNHCESLNKIKINEGVAHIGKGAFRYCKSLKTINFPVSLKTIDSSAFQCCVSLESIEIPQDVHVMGAGLFEQCSSLKSIKLPESVNMLTLYDSDFRGCKSLERIEIPDHIYYIKDTAFKDSPKCVIYCSANSYGEEYAKKNNIPYVIKSKG